MNWAAAAAICSALTLVGGVGVGGVLWGRLSEKVQGLTQRADSHKAHLEVLDASVSSLGRDVARLQEWKDGYNAAASVGRHTAELV